ncbi:uncharacterized protein B0H18DRAFT_457555 [Fomitopsis serialis]|uniref:uncharacterized protein n=1 Tax=Fomitopsis serialis TaxID=139415 RepID=UPI0020075C2B|nr:uncharacterized protein B0H18DRAFT_457555 [Neoantrodia serialis]KAH9923623.1 hypothetical protein B0H18DRAFT_457555 [Neoantrodia serialis]
MFRVRVQNMDRSTSGRFCGTPHFHSVNHETHRRESWSSSGALIYPSCASPSRLTCPSNMLALAQGQSCVERWATDLHDVILSRRQGSVLYWMTIEARRHNNSPASRRPCRRTIHGVMTLKNGRHEPHISHTCHPDLPAERHAGGLRRVADLSRPAYLFERLELGLARDAMLRAVGCHQNKGQIHDLPIPVSISVLGALLSGEDH